MTRGYKNNNPLNIRHHSDTFQGEVPSNDKEFKAFSSMEYGYRAAFINLATYNVSGKNTIEKIITHWSPPCENDTASYIANVVRYSGIPSNKILSLYDGADYILIVSSMSFVENGINADISQIRAGFKLQSKIKEQ